MRAKFSIVLAGLCTSPLAAQVETPTYAYTPLDATGLSRYCLGTLTRESDNRPARAFCQGFVLGAIEALQPSDVGKPGTLFCAQANQIGIIARIGYYAEKRVAPPRISATSYIAQIARELCREAAQ